MNKLNRFYLSQNISIDMNQILHQIVNQIKEIVDFINNLELRANEYTDQEILKLKNQLEDELQALETTLKTYTDDSINTYNAEVINPQLNEIRNTIDNVNTLLNNRITDEVNVLNRRINSVESSLIVMINETKEYLEDLIRKGNQLVYSGVSGKKIPIQDALKEIANASKQMLSYNWNTIDEFKTTEIVEPYDFAANGFTVVSNSDNKLYTKVHTNPTDTFFDGIINNNSVSVNDEQTDRYYIDINVGLTYISAFNGGNTKVFKNGTQLVEIPTTTDNGKIILQIGKPNSTDNLKYEISYTTPSGSGTLIVEFLPYDYITVTGESEITFNSIKVAMEYLEVNYNSLAYTGVNTFYELNKTEKLFDTDGVKSDYFTGNNLLLNQTI